MELKDTICKRRSVRDFKNIPVPQEIIKYSIENGFMAPSYNHMREWDFIIINTLETKLKLIDSENLNIVFDIEKLEKVFENEATIKKEMYLEAIPKQKKMILDAPQVVVVVFKPKTRVIDAKSIYDLNCLASVWTCIENFLLSLAENDVFGVTYIPKNIENLKCRLNVPSDLEIAAIIPIGYRRDDSKNIAQKEIILSERIHFEKW